MDRFLSIDWNAPLEDLIDNTFISEERLEKESVIYKILTGNFKDPFKNIEEDCKDVEIDLMKDADPDLNEMKKECEVKQVKKINRYVPGSFKPIFKFPKKSKLNKEQQAMCLRVLLRFSKSNKPKLTQKEREELKKYMSLQQIISEEQDEFLEFAKSKWNERLFNIMYEDFINLSWKSKLQHIYKLPRYYSEVASIPFAADKNVEVQFISNCLRLGKLPKIMLPTFTKPCILRINSAHLRKQFLPNENTFKESSNSVKLPVSEDINCQKLAEDNDVDLVISSSGLKCLVNNIDPTHSNSWILPIVIKRYNDKNVIYINKPAPPIASTVPEKNTWVYKYILKYFFIGTKYLTSESNEGDNIFDDVNSEKLLQLEEEYENTLTKIKNKISNVSNVSKEDKNLEGISTQQNLTNDVHSSDVLNCKKESLNTTTSNFCNASNCISNEDIQNKISEETEGSISYDLFTIGPQSEQSEMMKNVIKKYKILVRTKTHGFEILKNKVQRLLLLTPKLEHQADLGAEIVTLEEASKQWISLIFRPHTYLARVRISTKTSEVLQIEHRTAMSINNEIKRLYNIKVKDSLAILHNIIQSLADLSPGHYIMRHTVRNGAFAALFKLAEGPAKNVLDIHSIYSGIFYTLPNPRWIPLDKTLPTPMLKHFERMPTLFYPSNNKTLSNRKKCI
ncbi:hypothetical protein K0M31_020177 [Melipona bicolor]|uniref:Little elongation complex subunit 2 C-terminal domain-containing protein n=1 Tax=Melipona bicolor TaxID=60889 RepID=A0AA40KQI3_9HYME|nr:hypothetical protein K0M31_020177 [Melipona bicolor]